MDNHIDQVGAVTFVERFSKLNSTSEIFAKQAPNFCLLLLEYIKVLDIFYKIQNFFGTPWGSIITTYLRKFLSNGLFLIYQKLYPVQSLKFQIIETAQPTPLCSW